VVPWLGVGAPVDDVSCHTRTVAHAVSMVAQVGSDLRAEMQSGAERRWVV
jgi:hypothetical protein